MKSDGSDVRQMAPTAIAVFDHPPVWSPDGRHLAFIGRVRLPPETPGRFADPTLYVLAVDDLSLISLGMAWSLPRWSPDGSHLVFIRKQAPDDEPVLYAAEPDGSRPREFLRFDLEPPELSGPFGFVSSISWSPDRSQMLLTTVDYIWVADFRELDSAFKKIFVGHNLQSSAWSPDGSRLVVSEWSPSDRGDQEVLYTVALDGSDRKPLITFRERQLQAAGPS